MTNNIPFNFTFAKHIFLINNKSAFSPLVLLQREWLSKIEGAVTTLLKLDSQQPRAKSSSLWLESSQI